MSNISKAVIEALLPPGAIWQPAPGKGLDQLNDGIAENNEVVKDFLATLANLRDPNTTTILPDLEKEYGILTDLRIDETTRRNTLGSIKFKKKRTGSPDELQIKLTAADFNVLVHINNPAVDPALFLASSFQMVAGGANAYAGRDDAFAGVLGGELLVNGDIATLEPAYEMQAGGPAAFAGNQNAVAGYFTKNNVTPLVYEIPTDPNAWPYIFFVGGPATRDPVTGALTAIEAADVPTEREQELKKMILKYKTMRSWCGLIINLT